MPAIAFLSSWSKLNIWDALTMCERATLMIPKTNVTCFAIGPGGRLAAVGTAAGEISLAEISPDRVVTWRDLGRHGQRVMQVLFSRDGRVLASAGRDDELKIWNTAAPGAPVVIQEAIGSFARPCSLSADGARIAILTRHTTLNIYTTTAPRQLA